MARQGETASIDEDRTVPSLADYAIEESLRHRAVSELRLPTEGGSRQRSTIPPGTKDATGALTDELREGLWAAIAAYVFAPPSADVWAGSPAAEPTIHRVWTSPLMGGDPNDVPEDVADLIEQWFSVAGPGDVYALVETVLTALPDPMQVSFASACNVVLERGLSDHRFVGRRLMPIASKSDVATIERALLTCRSKHLVDAEAHLLASLDQLARKPEPDAPAAVHEAVRAVLATAFALTKERPFGLDDALDILEEQGHIDGALKARHGGLWSWVAQNGRKPRAEDARLILVTCAGFVTHLAQRL